MSTPVQELNKIDAYKSTKPDPKVIVETFKALFSVQTIY